MTSRHEANRPDDRHADDLHPERREPLGEPERGAYERRSADPAGRPVPFVDGPTGPAPLASELRGDPGEEGDRRGEGGALAGAVGGTAVAGPVGGAIGAVVGGVVGSAQDDGPRDEAGDTDPPGTQSNTTFGTTPVEREGRAR